MRVVRITHCKFNNYEYDKYLHILIYTYFRIVIPMCRTDNANENVNTEAMDFSTSMNQPTTSSAMYFKNPATMRGKNSVWWDFIIEINFSF